MMGRGRVWAGVRVSAGGRCEEDASRGWGAEYLH
jgi:hypothetical protein